MHNLEVFVYDLCKKYSIKLYQFCLTENLIDLADGHTFSRLTIEYTGTMVITPAAFDAMCKETKKAGYTLTLRQV